MKLTPKALELLSRILKTAHLGEKPLPLHVRDAVVDMLMTGRPLGRIVELNAHDYFGYRLHAVNLIADEGLAPEDPEANRYGMRWAPFAYKILCDYLTELEHDAQNI